MHPGTFGSYQQYPAHYDAFPSQHYALPPALYYSVDVECVATGLDHNARAVAQISLVDQYERVLLNLYVKPDRPVVSYLTPLTGLSQELVESQGMSLADAVATLRQYLPAGAILVGQNVGKDVEWLKLREGADFKSLVDLTGVFRVWNPRFKSWSVFSQDHLARVLLDWGPDAAGHDAVLDAVKSVRLFNLYSQLQAAPQEWQAAQEALLAAEPTESFAKRNPTFEGVCMGNRKTCKCGAPFLG